MQLRFVLTTDFIQRSYRRRLFRRWPLLLIGVVLTSVGLLMRSADSAAHLDALAIVGITVVGFMILFYASAWVRQRKAINLWMERQGSTPVTYTLTDSHLEVESFAGSGKLVWSVFEKVQITGFDTLLFYSGQNAYTFPTPEVPEAALDFIKTKLRECGKRIVDRRRSS